MWRTLANGIWIIAFLILGALFINEIVKATRAQQNAARAAEGSGGTGPWICPIAGQCGPPGTPGLGQWQK
jgi:hypothetical protein